MYIRKKRNRSGSTSVVVVSKAGGKYKEIKSFCASLLEEELESLCLIGLGHMTASRNLTLMTVEAKR